MPALKKPGRPPKPKTELTPAERTKAADARRSAATRIVSLSQFEVLTGHDRNVVSRWTRKEPNPCPTYGKGEKGSVLLDVREVLEWLQDEARREERAKFVKASEVHDADDEEMNREMKRLAIQTQQVLLAQKTAKLVRWQDVQMIFARALNSIRQPVMNIAVTQERDTAGWPKEMRASLKQNTQDTCRSTLKFAQQLLEKGLSDLAEGRLAELNGTQDDEDEDEALEKAVKDAFDE